MSLETATWVLAIFTVVLSFATIAYAYYTKQTGEELKNLNKELKYFSALLSTAGDARGYFCHPEEIPKKLEEREKAGEELG